VLGALRMSGRDNISLLPDQGKGYRLNIPYSKCLAPEMLQNLEFGIFAWLTIPNLKI
jgi:hypothetical protein